MAVLFI